MIEFERRTNTDKQFYFSATIERDPGAKLYALIFVWFIKLFFYCFLNIR